MADRKIEQLKAVPSFARCSRAELQELAANTDEVTLPAGRILITQGKSNATFFVLVSGEVDVSIDGTSRGTRGPGSIVGEISMLHRGPATATVTTTTPVEALVMSHAQFRNAVQAHDDIAFNVMAVMAERLRADSGGEG